MPRKTTRRSPRPRSRSTSTWRSPEKSLLLLKAPGGLDHKGGKKIEPGSADYQKLVAWIANGARWANEKAPRLVAVKVSPEKQTLKKGQTAALVVKAVYADGSEKDVTARCAVPVSRMRRSYDCGREEELRHGTMARRRIVATLPPPRGGGESGGSADIAAGHSRRRRPNNKIDELVNAKLKELGIPPAELCTDQEFLRRVFLDVIGTLPAPEEVRAFLADQDPQKRSKLIDQLLERPEYADYWTLKWGDLLRMKSETPVEMWPNAVQAYRHWVHDAILRNMPYDQFATELITATGSNFRDPAANFYRGIPALAVPPVAAFSRGADRDPPHQADAMAVVFMGVRTECVRCHAHPTENWTQEDHLGLRRVFCPGGLQEHQGIQGRDRLPGHRQGAPASGDQGRRDAQTARWRGRRPGGGRGRSGEAGGLADRARQSLVRQLRREPRLVLADGARHRA